MDETLKKILGSIEADYQAFDGDVDRLRRQIARRYRGTFFVSHTAADSAWCKHHIVTPIAYKYGHHSYFFLSSAQDAFTVKWHRIAVQSAFVAAKTIVCAVSQRSLLSDWTKLEALWAVEQRHPVIACLIDDADPSFLHPDLVAPGE